MKKILTALLCLCGIAAFAWEFQGDEGVKPRIQSTFEVLEAHGFPVPESVALTEESLEVLLGGEPYRTPLPEGGFDLPTALVDAELALLDRQAFDPWRDASSAFLLSRIHEREWKPANLREGLMKGFIETLIREDRTLLGGLWNETRGASWAGWNAFFKFHFASTPEAEFARAASAALPFLRPLMAGSPAVELKDGYVNFSLPPAPPLGASLVELKFPADRPMGASLDWEVPKFPWPAFLLAYYGPPLNTFEVLDLATKEGQVTFPFKGLSGLYVAAFSPDFSGTAQPIPLHSSLVENYPFLLKEAQLLEDTDGVALSFEAEGLQEVDSFVLLKGTSGNAALPQPVGTVPGLGTSPDAFTFTLIDTEGVASSEKQVYYLYALTEDGFLSQAASFPVGPAAPGAPVEVASAE
jgi:hypothetical protein